MSSEDRGSRPGWWLDELATVGRENLDAAHVARYDAKEDAGAAAEVALLTALGLDAGSVVVDLGAGTGQFALTAARCTGARVVAVDVSPVMLAALRDNVRAAGLANVEVVDGGLLSYEHHGRPADVVYARYVLHHLPDFWKAIALARARRLLRPGGVLRLWDVVYRFEPHEAADRIEAWCATGGPGTDTAAQWSRPAPAAPVRDEHSTFAWLLEPMLERCGFAIETREYSGDGIFAKYLARAI